MGKSLWLVASYVETVRSNYSTARLRCYIPIGDMYFYTFPYSVLLAPPPLIPLSQRIEPDFLPAVIAVADHPA